VTIEDILEEIVGEITDEYDSEEVPDVVHLDGRRLRVNARLPVADFAELFPGVDGEQSKLSEVLEDADVDTVGGLLAQQMGKVPLPGARAEVAGLELLAEGGKDARGRVRIISVLVEPLEQDEDGEPDGGPDAADDRATENREENDVRYG